MANTMSKQEAQRLLERRASVAEKLSKYVAREAVYNIPRLKQFLGDYKTVLISVCKEEIEKNTEKADQCAELIGKNVANLDAIKSKLEELGISLSFEMQYSLSMGTFESEEEKKDHFEVYQEFNGAMISKEMLSAEGLAKFKKEHEGAESICERYKAEEKMLEKQIAENQRKLKHTFSSRKKEELKDCIEEDNLRLSQISSLRNSEEKARHKIEVIEGLSPEQKQEILRYMEASENLIATTRLIDEYKRRIAEIKNKKGGKELATKALDRLILQNQMSPREIVEIFGLVKTIENKVLRGIFDYRAVTKKDIPAEEYVGISEVLLRYIYEPEKELEKQEFLIERGIEPKPKVSDEPQDNEQR